MSRPVVFPLTELLALSLAVPLAVGACAEAPAPAPAPAPVPATGQVPASAEPAKVAASGPAAHAPSVATPAMRKPASCAQTGSGSCEGAHAGARGEAGHEDSCEGASAPLRNPAQERVTTASGQQAVHVGDAFAPAGQIPTVTVSALLAAPDKWAGKKVRVQGDVTAMCHHKRGWFAVAAEDKSGRALRVITTPVFLVPQGSIGRGAVAEGRVDVIEVAARFAQHMATEHKLGEPAKTRGPQRQVILRATGAEFL